MFKNKKMMRIMLGVSLCLMIFSVANVSFAALINKGDMFYDDQSGLYWYDPIYFLHNLSNSSSRSVREASVQLLFDDVEAFLVTNVNWRWATDPEVQMLYDGSLGIANLEQIIGTHTGVADRGSFVWMGMCQLHNDHNLASGLGANADNTFLEYTVTVGPPLYNAPLYYPEYSTVGAWIVSTSVPIPSAVWLLGSGLLGLVGLRRKFRKA